MTRRCGDPADGPECGGAGRAAGPLTARGGRACLASWAPQAPRCRAWQVRPAGQVGGAAAGLSPGCSSPGSRPAGCASAAPQLRSTSRCLWLPRLPPAKWRRGGAGRGRGAVEPPAPARTWTHLSLRTRPPPSCLPRGRAPRRSAKLSPPSGPPICPPPVVLAAPPLSFYFPPPLAWEARPFSCLPVSPLLRTHLDCRALAWSLVLLVSPFYPA